MSDETLHEHIERIVREGEQRHTVDAPWSFSQPQQRGTSSYLYHRNHIIWRAWQQGARQTALADIFGITQGRVRAIICREEDRDKYGGGRRLQRP